MTCFVTFHSFFFHLCYQIVFIYLFFLVWSSHAFLYPRQFSHAALFSSPSSVSFLPPPLLYLSFSPLISPSPPSLSAEAHQGKQMLWLLFMFPLGLAFIQIIYRPCTVQTLSLTGLRWQLPQPHPHSDTQAVPQTRKGVVARHRGWQSEP